MNNHAKIELHVHLEGTISPQLAKKIALRNKIKLPSNLFLADEKGYYSDSFQHFLKTFDLLSNIIRSPQDYHDIVYDYLRICALESTLYVELMYSPLHAEKMTGIPSKEHLLAINDAIYRAEQDYGIMARVIITGVRHYGVESCELIASQALREPMHFVTGFGLGGDEINFPAHLFEKTYKIAKEAGLGATIHAGEFGPPESIIEAIDTCGVSRIGHGVNAIFSEHVMQKLLENEIHLEICPSSNLHFSLFETLQSHPIKTFYQRGISMSINSDDPPFFSTNIGNEYQKIATELGFSSHDFDQINSMAIQHAFLDAENKQKLTTKLRTHKDAHLIEKTLI
jgi:adenosine deaminase